MNVTKRQKNPSCTANRILYNGWLQLCPVCSLPKSYILTRSGLFQEFGAVSRTNVLRKPLYRAAGSLARIWWQERGAKSDNREGNFLRGEEIWESLGVKKAALNVLGDLLPGCVYTVAADLCLQPCSRAGAKGWRAEPPLTTSHNSTQQTYHRSQRRVQGISPLPPHPRFHLQEVSAVPWESKHCYRLDSANSTRYFLDFY